MTERLGLGEWVWFSHRLSRIRQGAKRSWWAVPLPEPQRGMIVGFRWLSDGVADVWYEDYGSASSEYRAENRFWAYLVVTHPRKDPIYVRAEHLVPNPELAEFKKEHS